MIDDFSSPPVAAAIRAYLEILGPSTQWFSVPNLRSQAIICRVDKGSMPRDSFAGFARLPGWATGALEIAALCRAVRALSASPLNRETALTMSALAHDALLRVARILELCEERRAIPYSPLAALSWLALATANICAKLETRANCLDVAPACAAIREHLIYAANRAAIEWPEKLGEPPKRREANFGAASPETIAVLRELSAHAANFVDAVAYRLI
ncbi:MAG TPA: hypothetical protein VG328_03940 [Stellaceae bacterium]|nr:hypothetical protein [Stellaceae bacterium]